MTPGASIGGQVTARPSPPASVHPAALETSLQQAIGRHPALLAASAAWNPAERRQAARAIAAAVMVHLRRAGIAR
jgi:hypothetical protein